MKKYNFVSELPSASNPDKMYAVKMDEKGNLTCNCPVWVYNHRKNRTCKHTDIVQKSGFLEGKARLLVGVHDKNWYGETQNKVPVVCKGYPDSCSECVIRFRCYTEKNPEFGIEELIDSGVI